jgi:hypothetical protein
VASDEILENCQNRQLPFLSVYWYYQLANSILEVIKLSNFLEKTFLNLFRRLRAQTDERTLIKMQNTRDTLKNLFLDQYPRVV